MGVKAWNDKPRHKLIVILFFIHRDFQISLQKLTYVNNALETTDFPTCYVQTSNHREKLKLEISNTRNV